MGDLDATMRALQARTRREILSLLWDRERSVGEIAEEFPLTTATISGHLRVLREAGLVEVARVGTFRRYRAVPGALEGLDRALEGTTKWRPANDIPERGLATVSIGAVVTAVVDVPTSAETTFDAFTSGEVYARWLQVPVTIEDGRFAATLEWGTEVRGRYLHVARPALLVMSWDFEDENVPVPGNPLTAYLHVERHGSGSRVRIHQLVENTQQAVFMEAAWGMVLGRLRLNIEAATAGAQLKRRGTRPKRVPPDPGHTGRDR
jgi:DNA-binding transcriptional ArsR family regulator